MINYSNKSTLWKTESGKSWYKIHYCNKCQCQRTLHYYMEGYWTCDTCGNKQLLANESSKPIKPVAKNPTGIGKWV